MHKLEQRLDVRSMLPSQRHTSILRVFGALPCGQALVVITDYDARPLHIELEHLQPSRYTWAQRRLSDHWEVTIRKIHPAIATNSSLERSPVFAQADAETIATLGPLGRRANIKRDRAIAEQGISWPYLGLVEAGIVQAVLATDSGREQVLFDALPGEVFGEAALIDHGPTLVRYIAQTAGTVILLLPVEAVRKRLRVDAALFRALADLNAQHTRTILDRFALLLTQPAVARIAAVLLSYASPADGLTAALQPLPTMTQPEIARLAGTIKEIVQRSLPKLEGEGAIRREGNRIIEVDRAKLLRLASS